MLGQFIVVSHFFHFFLHKLKRKKVWNIQIRSIKLRFPRNFLLIKVIGKNEKSTMKRAEKNLNSIKFNKIKVLQQLTANKIYRKISYTFRSSVKSNFWASSNKEKNILHALLQSILYKQTANATLKVNYYKTWRSSETERSSPPIRTAHIFEEYLGASLIFRPGLGDETAVVGLANRCTCVISSILRAADLLLDNGFLWRYVIV